MPNGNSSGAHLVRVLLFASFFTTMLVYSPNVMVLQPVAGGAGIGSFAEPFLLLVIACSLVVCSVSALRPDLSVRFGSREFVLAAAGMYVAGSLGLIALLLGGWGSEVAFVFLAVLTACGFMPLVLAWSSMLDDLDLPRAAMYVGAVLILSACANLGLTFLPAPALCAGYVLFLLAGVSAPVAHVLGLRGGGEVVDDARVGAAPDGNRDFPRTTGPYGSKPGIPGMLQVLGVPLLGMAISSFTMGVQPLALFSSTVDAQRLGMVIGGLLVLAIYLMREKRPLFLFIYQVFLPAMATICVILLALPGDGPVFDVALATTYVFYAMVSAFAIASACAAANAGEFPRALVFGALVLTFAAFAFLGIRLGALVDGLIDSNTTVLRVLTCAYACWMLLSGSYRAWRLSSMTQDEQAPASASQATGEAIALESFEDRVGRLAAEFGLSPRETEIVGYVGRGHSSVFVAKTLLISESTVYTHVRNVYRKLGIGSREDLINMLNDRKPLQ